MRCSAGFCVGSAVQWSTVQWLLYQQQILPQQPGSKAGFPYVAVVELQHHVEKSSSASGQALGFCTSMQCIVYPTVYLLLSPTKRWIEVYHLTAKCLQPATVPKYVSVAKLSCNLLRLS